MGSIENRVRWLESIIGLDTAPDACVDPAWLVINPATGRLTGPPVDASDDERQAFAEVATMMLSVGGVLAN